MSSVFRLPVVEEAKVAEGFLFSVSDRWTLMQATQGEKKQPPNSATPASSPSPAPAPLSVER